MDTLKPFEKIASQFRISQETAKYFLNHVQKSFKKERPPHQLILDFINTLRIELLPQPYEIARLMKENGVWDYALGSPPPVIVDDEEPDMTQL